MDQWVRRRLFACRAAFVVRMESLHLRHRDDLAAGSRVNWLWLRAIHSQRHAGTKTVDQDLVLQ
jgi:hypothetical protein